MAPAQLHHSFERYEPWQGEIRLRASGSLVADRKGTATAFAITNLSERGSMFVGPGEEVYEGMIVGESSRGDDMDVNVTREKKLTNMRSSTSDDFVKLPPIRRLTLEQALEHADETECVEVTPTAVRLRKSVLSRHDRRKGDRGASAGSRPTLRAARLVGATRRQEPREPQRRLRDEGDRVAGRGDDRGEDDERLGASTLRGGQPSGTSFVLKLPR